MLLPLQGLLVGPEPASAVLTTLLCRPSLNPLSWSVPCLVLGGARMLRLGSVLCFRSTRTPVAATVTAALATCLSPKRSCSETLRAAGR